MFAHFPFTQVFTCVFCIGLVGCGGGLRDTPQYQTVHGRVTLDGDPLDNAMISFQPEKGPPSGAVTDADGNYILVNRDGGKGAVEGKHRIEISTDLNGERTADAERVPTQYNVQSTLSADVSQGDNEVDFELKSK
jgi:hypothetical protein